MSRVFIISDTHFGHGNILRLRPGFSTVEEMNAALIHNWNSVVTKRDTVYHLGDVAWTKKAAYECLPQLNGNKILVAGNHDVWSWVSPFFDKILGARHYSEFILTHIPIHPTEFYEWKLNLHGHLHTTRVLTQDSSSNDPRYLCVSVEQINYTPVDIHSFTKQHIEKHKTQIEELHRQAAYWGHRAQ